MTAAPFVLTPQFSVREGLKALIDNRVLGIPVVERDGRYVGMFVKSALITACLPRVIALEETMPDIGRLIDAGYAADTISDVRARFQAIANEPVSKFIDPSVPMVKPSTPLTVALHFLHRVRNFVPVVDDDGHLAGVVSTWDALAKIAKAE